MKAIIVIIEDIQDYTIVPEKNFIDGNEFKTQNRIIEVLELLGFKKYKCDLVYLEK